MNFKITTLKLSLILMPFFSASTLQAGDFISNQQEASQLKAQLEQNSQNLQDIRNRLQKATRTLNEHRIKKGMAPIDIPQSSFHNHEIEQENYNSPKATQYGLF